MRGHHWGTIFNSCPLLNDNKVAYTVLGDCSPSLSFYQSQKLIHRMVSLHKGVLNRQKTRRNLLGEQKADLEMRNVQTGKNTQIKNP